VINPTQTPSQENKSYIKSEFDLSQATQRLINQYQNWYRLSRLKKDTTTIHVDEVASKVAAFYEKIREIVDWKEEHIMRRMAIERILKRRLFLEQSSGGAAEPFICELIRGGHFPNDQIEKSKIKEIQYIIDKYTYILKQSPSPSKGKTRGQLYIKFLGIAACEIEETLDPVSYIKANALIEYMEVSIQEKIVIEKETLKRAEMNEKQKNIQIYIAVQRALLSLDSPIISYNLLKRQYPSWSALPPDTLGNISSNIYSIWQEMEKVLFHPLGNKFYKICERYDTSYLLLGDIMSKNPQEVSERIRQPKTLERLTEQAYDKRLEALKSRSHRAAFYSTLSIFISNVAVLYIIEVPLTIYIIGQFNIIAMVVDILAPTFLMFLLVITIRLPGQENLKLVYKEVKKITYGQGKDIYKVRFYPKRSFTSRLIFNFLYFLTFCMCFGLMTWGLYKINYPPISYLIMYVFISLIAFTGIKIRQRARELHVTEEKETIFDLIVDPFALPLVRLGKWLRARWQRINIVSIIFNWIIEMPFSVFIEFLEQWRYFLKEKKEEIH
jgi:hypothetical protein